MPAPKGKKKREQWKRNISLGMAKMTPEILQKLSHAFATGATAEQACVYADFNIRTFYDYKKRHPNLSQYFERMQQKLPLAAKNNIAEAIENKDIASSWKLLERKEPDAYAEITKLQHSGNIDTTGEFNDADNDLREEFRKKLKERIHKRANEEMSNAKTNNTN